MSTKTLGLTDAAQAGFIAAASTITSAPVKVAGVAPAAPAIGFGIK